VLITPYNDSTIFVTRKKIIPYFVQQDNVSYSYIKMMQAYMKLYIDVGRIVGPGRTWRPPSPLFTSRPNFLIFLFSPLYILFKVILNTKSESTTLI
jgi:hypothetical protein